MDTDPASFTKLVNERVKNSAERCLLFQSPIVTRRRLRSLPCLNR